MRVSSERPSEALPTPSPAPTSEIPLEPQPDSSPAQTSEVPIEHQPTLSPRLNPLYYLFYPRNFWWRILEVSDQAKEIQDLKAQITKLKKQAKPVIKHHKAYLKSVSLKQRFLRKSFSKKHRVHKESVSKQGRKFAKEWLMMKGEREIVDEDKEIEDNVISTEDVLSTDKEGVSTDIEKVSTDRPIVSTDKQIEACGILKHAELKIKKFEEVQALYEKIKRSNGQKRYFSTLMSVLSIFDKEDLDAVYQLVMDRFQDEMPEATNRGKGVGDWKIMSWKLHSSSGVHTLVTKEGVVIHMLVEKKYPLRKEVLMQMLKLKLESEEDNTMALELIKFVKKILAELESEEHKNWLVHKQTACGKDFSNPFMVDNLPKIVRFSTHLASVVKSWLVHDQTVHALASPKANELTIPEQTATGKGTSNPLMAGSLPKTTKPT
ncbi:hypothetical protein Tco_0705149 [Tanacetum coccineum]|uniref:Uncharacterized protein n=1 Tax=Tanacetum coccineum TaxID=301880 RepID=A0ABQ4Y5B5_9ASTR